MSDPKPLPPSEVVLVELRRLRLRKEWTQDDLAARITELGVPMDRGTIAKIETGRRNVSVDDVFLLAAALEVAPLALLTPRESDAPVQVAPNSVASARLVRHWVSGQVALYDDIAERDLMMQGKFGTTDKPAMWRWYFEQAPDETVAARRFLPALDEINRMVGNIADLAVVAEGDADLARYVAEALHQLAREAKHAAGTVEARYGKR